MQISMIKYFVLLFILLVSATNFMAQDKDIESLLQNATKEEKLELYNQLVDENYSSNPTKCIKYAIELEKIAKKTENKDFEIKAYKVLATLYYEQKNYKKSNKFFEKELLLIQNKGNKLEVAKSYYNLATSYLKNDNKTKARINFDRSLDLALALKSKPLMIANYKALSKVNSDLGKFYYALEDLKKYILHSEGEYSEEIILFKEQYFQEKEIKEHKIEELNVTKSNLNKTETELIETEEVVMGLEEETQEKSEQISELSIANELKNLKITRKEDELKKQRFVTLVFIIGFAVIFFFSFVLLRMFLSKKKMNKLLEKQKENITESIVYASRIQSAILPKEIEFIDSFSEHFVLFNPRDIVSGDFYFMQKINQYSVIAAIDCTGHGVPGAFMSMLGMAFLNEIVRHREVTKANQILDLLREKIKTSLQQTGEKGERKDGMDMALCVINYETMKMQFAGAYNPLLLIRNNELKEYKADRMPIGVHIKDKKSFTNHIIKIQSEDRIYLYSDGYGDQFGGSENEKFMKKRLKNYLLEINNFPMKEQKEKLENTFEQWKGNFDQIDDVVIVGIKI